MTDAEKVQLQKKIIKELTEENEALKHDGKVLLEENAMLRKSKEEMDIEQAEQLAAMKLKIEEYRKVVDEIQKLKKEFSEEKRKYASSVLGFRKEAKEMFDGMKPNKK